MLALVAVTGGAGRAIIVGASSTTDWITAVAGVFAAVGTVGAVIVALNQIRRQERRHLAVDCLQGIMSPAAGVTANVVTLRATNDGVRPVKVSQAYLQTNDQRKIFARFVTGSGQLPALLLPGESIDVTWAQDELAKARAEHGFERYLFAFFVDTLGNVYPAAYPGVERRRVGRPWGRRDEWVPRLTTP